MAARSRALCAFNELARTKDSRSAPTSAEVPLSSGGVASRLVLTVDELAGLIAENRRRGSPVGNLLVGQAEDLACVKQGLNRGVVQQVIVFAG